MSKKFINIIKMIKSNKRYKYTLVVTIMLLFISIIGYSLSFFNHNTSNLVANIKVNDLSFNMTTNTGESDDRILRLKSGKSESFYVKLKNLNNINVKYELKYSVCSDSVCTNTLTTLPDNVKVFVMPNSKSKVNGEISTTENNIVEIELLTLNYSNNDVYIKLDLNAGYTWNELALENQFELSTSDGKNQEKNMDIIAYVDGIEAEEYPRSCNYLTKIKGYNGDIEVSIPESYVVCDRKTNTWKMVVDVLVKKVVINFTYKEGAPAFTYTGNFEIANGDNADWKIRLLSSGTLTFKEEPPHIDVFLVGGGGGGGKGFTWYNPYGETNMGGGGGGGAGGYGLTKSNISVSKDKTYNIVIGTGGTSGKAGGSTSAFTFSVNGGGAGATGQANDTYPNGYGGTGGNGGNKGGTGHGDSNQNSKAEAGSSGATSTKEFGTGTAYAGGGGGGGHCQWSSTTAGASGGTTGGGGGGQGTVGKNGTANTGGGGGGGGAPSTSGTTAGGSGGSGIVVIRSHKVNG